MPECLGLFLQNEKAVECYRLNAFQQDSHSTPSPVEDLIEQLMGQMDAREACGFLHDRANSIRNIIIKPNLVTHRHYRGDDFLSGSVVHASVLRPLLFYLKRKFGDASSIVIADNPVEGADFKTLMEKTGIAALISGMQAISPNDISVLDLRPYVVTEDDRGRFAQECRTGDPLGYVEIDLGRDSMFAELDAVPGIHYYTLADSTVDHFDPHKVQTSRTDKYHRPGVHKYLVSRTILDSDLIVNVAKMKTHCKAGVSLCLKNMIGMVYLKECMPHHRPGPPPQGDSFHEYPAAHYVATRKAYRFLRERIGIHRLPGFKAMRNLMQRKKILVGQHIEHGNWKGNDTIWRTILDLNRIAIYSDKNGVMRDTPQRQMLCIIDGIIAQQGEGPMAGEPVKAGILFGGWNPVMVDALAVKAMGLDYRAIPQLARALEITRWPLLPPGEHNLSCPESGVPNFNFTMPRGWQ